MCKEKTILLSESVGHHQGREFAHSLISLKSNERLWAICSDCSEEMSDHERIAQVAQDKWATVSELLKTNEHLLIYHEQPEQIAQKIFQKKI